ncbi:hypothetical protein BDR06DRAFT_1013637 [Suillus hirtellus]|nr:hypothetical protein BDR06DRAFT_1013637 [Suillus hirtellus]
MSTATMPPPSPEMSSTPTPPPLPDSLHNVGDVFQCGHTEITLQSVCVKLVVIAIVDLLAKHPTKNEAFRCMIRQIIWEEAEEDYNTWLQAYEAAVAAATEGTETTTDQAALYSSVDE